MKTPEPPNCDQSVTPTHADERWVEVAVASDLPDKSAMEIYLEGRVIALFRHDGELYAIDGMCAHQAGPLAQGTVSGRCVTCPWHGWTYDLATGQQITSRQPLLETFLVRQRDDRIEIRIANGQAAEPSRGG